MSHSSLQSLVEALSRLAPVELPGPGSAEAAPNDSPTVAAPGPAAAPPLPSAQLVDHAVKGVHLDARVSAAEVLTAANAVATHGFAMDTITGVDWIAEGEMEVVYDYFHPLTGERVAVRARVPRDRAVLPTILGAFPAANWHERETHDFFGIRFEGHPDLTPLLLPEDADFHPLRKDYQA